MGFFGSETWNPRNCRCLSTTSKPINEEKIRKGLYDLFRISFNTVQFLKDCWWVGSFLVWKADNMEVVMVAKKYTSSYANQPN